jgi:Caspase domain
MVLPNLEASRAVLIGTARYEHLVQLPNVANNLRDLTTLLSRPDVWGIPAENCIVIADPLQPIDIVGPLARAAEAAKDTLIVYYAGHGLLDEERSLYLALTGSSADGADYTATAYRVIRKRVFESPAMRKIVILDCCYAARAFGMGDTIANITEKATIDGTYLLAAAAENKEALADPDEPHTAFTGEFIKLLREGITEGPEFFEMDYIYRKLHDILTNRNMPVPQSQNRNHISSLTLFRNVQYNAPNRLDMVGRKSQRSEPERQAHNICINSSEPFLRRNKLANHHQLYVPRALDRDITNAIRAISPQKLSHMTRSASHQQGGNGSSNIALAREAPPQVAIVLDPPGSGKTMLATQLALHHDSFLCVARTADNPDVHDLPAQLEMLGTDHGLKLMMEIDKPFVYIIDGMDENDIPAKRADIAHMLRSLSELNRWAVHRSLLAFPVFIIMTAKKDIWERWISVFEGRSLIRFRNRLTRFTDEELERALSHYYNAYQYSFAKPLPTAAADILSIPLNLSVLSEALEYQGEDIPAQRILGQHVLTYYFDWLAPRVSPKIADLTNDAFQASLCDLAFAAIQAPQGHIDEGAAVVMLSARFSRSSDLAADFLEILVQARLLIREIGVRRWLRFRYSSIVEYLVALSAIRKPDIAQLDEITIAASESSEISASAVKQNVLALARSGPAGLTDAAEDYYVSSPTYISREVSHLRVGFGSGHITESRDIEAIYNTIGQMQPDNAFDAFFVIAAKPNCQPAERILEVFNIVWQLNVGRADRWKMLEKVADHGLVTQPQVLSNVAQSQVPREWEVFLGRLHQRDDCQRVAAGLQPSFSAVAVPTSRAWDQAIGLFDLAARGLAFTPGSVFGPSTADQYRRLVRHQCCTAARSIKQGCAALLFTTVNRQVAESYKLLLGAPIACIQVVGASGRFLAVQ